MEGTDDGAGARERRTARPLALVDGSKVVLRVARNDTFTFTRDCRLLLSSQGVKLSSSWGQTVGTNLGNDLATAAIDSGLPGRIFIPIRIAEFGAVYTQEGEGGSVTVGGAVERQRVRSRGLPCRTCYKYCLTNNAKTESVPLIGGPAPTIAPTTTSGWGPASETATGAQVTTEAAIATIHSSNGLLFIRGDESTLRYTLQEGEKIKLQSSRLLAWSVGCRFDIEQFCCFRWVEGVIGPGTIWVQAAHPRLGVGLPPTPWRP